MENRKFTYKECLALLLLLIAAAGLYLWTLLRPTGSTVIIERNGTEIRRAAFTSLSEPETIEIDDVVIELSRDGARFVSSPCPDQVCVEAGTVSRAGASAVCLPERISIRVIGEAGSDSTTG